jgi:hypothetical protein
MMGVTKSLLQSGNESLLLTLSGRFKADFLQSIWGAIERFSLYGSTKFSQRSKEFG